MSDLFEVEPAFRAAEELRINGQAEEAITAYTAILQEVPVHAHSLQMRGVAKGMRRQWDGMVRDTTLAISLFEKLGSEAQIAGAKRDRAKGHANLGLYDAAYRDIEDAIDYARQAGKPTDTAIGIGFRARIEARHWADTGHGLHRWDAATDFMIAAEGLNEADNRHWELYNASTASMYLAIIGKHTEAAGLISRGHELNDDYGNRDHRLKLAAAGMLNLTRGKLPQGSQRHLTRRLIR